MLLVIILCLIVVNKRLYEAPGGYCLVSVVWGERMVCMLNPTKVEVDVELRLS